MKWGSFGGIDFHSGTIHGVLNTVHTTELTHTTPLTHTQAHTHTSSHTHTHTRTHTHSHTHVSYWEPCSVSEDEKESARLKTCLDIFYIKFVRYDLFNFISL